MHAGRKSILCCGLLLALTSIPCATAQTAQLSAKPQQFAAGGGASLSSSETIVKRVDEVNLLFTVRNKKGEFVKNLTQNDIQVLDDQRPPESVRYFQQQTDLPLRVGLLVDVSGSVFQRFAVEQKAATAFLTKVLHSSSDVAFVAGFDSSVHVAQGLTNDTQALAKAVQSLKPAGETALYDAVQYACQTLAHANDETPVRRVVILFTDGMDNRSRLTLEDAIATALRDEVAIYAISINAPEAVFARSGEEALTRLARATGGRVISALTNRQAANAFDSIQQELRSQYALGYKPADFQANGRYRTIKVTVRSRKLRVHARQGYFAQNERRFLPSGP